MEIDRIRGTARKPGTWKNINQISNVVDFGASGDGLYDDTIDILQGLQHGDVSLQFPPGEYLITHTVPIEL